MLELFISQWGRVREGLLRTILSLILGMLGREGLNA